MLRQGKRDFRVALQADRIRIFMIATVALVLAAASPAHAITDTFETAPERDPADALHVPVQGPGYRFVPPARSENGYRVYQLSQDGQIVTLTGDGLVLQHLRELAVLHSLKEARKSETFVKGLKEAAQKPVDFVQSTVTDPIGTARSTATGVGKVLGRITSGVEKAVTGEIESPGEFAKAITGQSQARRELALSLGVDPYTTYQPLSDALDEAATVSTAGSIGVQALLSLIPGGVAVGALGLSEDMRQAVISETREELLVRVKEALLAQGVDPLSANALLANVNYTPTELASVAYHLQGMPELKDKTLLVNQAASATERGLAYAELRRISLLLHYDKTISPLISVRLLGGEPVAFTADGAAIMALPLDSVAWTKPMATRFNAINEELERSAFPPTRVELIIPGDMTDLAAERLTNYGWDVTATYPMPDSVIH